MRHYSWRNAPFHLATLETAQACPDKHFVESENVATRSRKRFYDAGRPLPLLEAVTEFQDFDAMDKAIHENLNMPARPKPKPVAAPMPVAASTAPPESAAAE